MASHVVVVDSTARRAQVKTTPGTYLSDVLSQACEKLGADPSQSGLKHNNKQIDLSRTIRLSGLTSGAKLELVQLSKSAGVVSVALQLPPSLVKIDGPTRLTDKLPSSTTLWILLRRFESGKAGAEKNVQYNFTQRGVTSTDSGAGRLFYEQPVLTVLGRELADFTSLQKSLASLGLNSGSVLVKLDFRPSTTPLEEAMMQIQTYFEETDPQHATVQKLEPTLEDSSSELQPPKVEPEWLDDKLTQVAAEEPSTLSTTEEAPPTATIESHRVSVYLPPSISTSTIQHNEADYVPTVEHAQIHQKLLQQESRNRRLPTDAEIAAKERDSAAELDKITKVDIRARFPDLTFVDSAFTQYDTTEQLYSVVRGCLSPELQSEKFVLRLPGGKGGSEAIPSDGSRRIIKDLKLRGKVLVVFSWDESASQQVRARKDVLKPELRQQATEYKPPEIAGIMEDDQGTQVSLGKRPESNALGEEKKGKMPKWLKGLGKK